MKTRQTKYSANSYWTDVIYRTNDLVATNLNAAESYTEDTALNLTNIVISSTGNNATITLTLSNPNAGSLNTGTSGSVTSTYNSETGIWRASGAIANVNVLLAALTFTPAANFNSNFTIAVSLDNGEGQQITGVKTMTGIAVNDAPVLDASKTPTLNPIAQDSPVPSGAVGTLVSSLVDLNPPSGGLDNVTDVENNVPGVAIVAVDTTNGTWYYSINNGTTWNAMGAVSGSSSRLLAPAARIYFKPTASYNGTVATAITFRAWDQTSGTNGSTANTTSNGGSTAFSSATDTASITVTPP